MAKDAFLRRICSSRSKKLRLLSRPVRASVLASTSSATLSSMLWAKSSAFDTSPSSLQATGTTVMSRWVSWACSRGALVTYSKLMKAPSPASALRRCSGPSSDSMVSSPWSLNRLYSPAMAVMRSR